MWALRFSTAPMIIGHPALAKMTKTMRKAMSIHITNPLSGRNKSMFGVFLKVKVRGEASLASNMNF
jgi:hypothetical protein